MKKHLALPLIALAFLLVFAGAAQAQLLTVTGEYRVVEVDKAGMKFGVALRDANPDVVQNWVHVKPDAKIVQRQFLPNRAFRDENMTVNGFFDFIQKGTKLRVHGGRDWDKSIHADKIWL